MKNLFNTKTLFIALIVGFVGLTFGQDLFAQGSGERTVFITITETGEGPAYTVEPYELVIPEKTSNVPIRFRLESADYEFINSGNYGFSIQLDNGEFNIRGLSHRNQGLLVMDFNRIKQDYYYTITVINPATGATLLIDPRIKNGGGGGND